jgi:hypothetical protein
MAYERRSKQMAANYRDQGRRIKASDYVVLALQAILVALALAPAVLARSTARF